MTLQRNQGAHRARNESCLGAHRLRLLAAPSLAALSLAVLSPAAALAQAPAPDQPPAPVSQPAPSKPAPSKPAPNKSATVEGLVVQAAPQAAVRTSIDRRSYSIAGDLQAANGSIADALRNIPGAQVDLSGNLTLRGGPVQIMIDGQPSQVFSGPQAAQVLASMPADRIDRVEVINNPSAAYSPEGQAGIINLVTKKSAPSGPSGGIRANAGTSGHDNVAGNVVYQKGKLTLLGDAGWRQDQQKLRFSTTGTVVDPITGLNDPRSQTEVTAPPSRVWNAHAGFSYQLDPKTQLSGDARYQAGGVDHYDDYSFLTTDPSGTPIAAQTRVGTTHPRLGVSSEQLIWRRQLPGQDHSLVLFYSHTLIQVPTESPSTSLTTVPAPPVLLYQDQVANFGQDVNEFKIDYTKPMPKMGQLKAGYDLRNTDSNFNNYALFGGSAASAALNPLYTNVFHYGQMVNAGYVTYEQPVGNLTVLGGLRVEDERLSLDQHTQSVTVDRDEVGVFPTLHLGYKQNSNVTWIANYSLRIQRPNPQDLNPYRNLTNPFAITVGNPLLEPEKTNSFEAGWQYRKGATTYLATAFYRQSENGVTDVVTDLGAGVLQTSRANVSSGKVSGLELVAAGPLTKTLSYNVSTNFTYTQLETPVLGVRETHEGFGAGGRGSLNWSPTKTDLIQLIGIINPGRVTAQGTIDPLLILAAGYQHKITKDFSLVLQTQDPFDTVRQYSRITAAGLDQRTTLKAHIQTFLIGFTWNFGGNGRPQRDPGFDVGSGGL
jgi:outer membrane receptor protein involved in Fe transport